MKTQNKQILDLNGRLLIALLTWCKLKFLILFYKTKNFLKTA